MTFSEVILDGERVRLEPLSEKHRAGLCEAIADGELWKLFFTLVPHTDQIDGFLAKASADNASGDGIAFATIDKASNRVVGSTRFMRANLPHRRVEIGFTFLGRSWQKTGINIEAKYLMLCHAFETLQMNRVEFLTDYLNNHSRKAILGLGAKEEGLLSRHMVMPDGRVRDSVLYAITDYEWPGVKQHLLNKLHR